MVVLSPNGLAVFMPVVASDPLRICICLSLFHPTSGGVETQMLQLARRWSAWGHQPIVLTRPVAGARSREILDGIEIRRVIRTLPLGPLFGATFIANLAVQLARFRQRYDVIVSGQVPWEGVAAGWISQRLKKPAAVCIQQTGPYGDLRQIEQARGSARLKSGVLSNARFVPLSRLGVEEALAFGCPRRQIVQLTSGVDCTLFQPTLPVSPERQRTVLFVGRLVAQKNPMMLLRAWNQVNRAGAYRLLLAGSGPLEAELRAYCQEEQLRGVSFLGYCSDMPALYSQAGIYCLPSRGEGCPNALLEAMASGLVPVVTHVGGNLDVVRDQVNGREVPDDDHAALALALSDVLEQPDRQATFGQAAREHVVLHHDLDAVAAGYVTMFRQMLNE